MDPAGHVPVMLDEVLAALAPQPDGRYVDATLGRCGHTAALLALLGPQGQVLALDRDPQAVHDAQRRFAAEPRLRLRHGNFADLAAHLAAAGWTQVQGVLFDLGISSAQLDDPARGLSFTHEGPLDMRLDPTAAPSAADLVATLDAGALEALLRDYGEERYARRIAGAIVAARAVAPITTTQALVAVIRAAVPRVDPHKHVATRSFQALRIAVNGELAALDQGLVAAHRALAVGGRLVVLSFHSLEDRRVKRFLRQHAGRPPGRAEPPRRIARASLRLVGGAQRASAAEITRNPRARSAVLRVAEKLTPERAS